MKTSYVTALYVFLTQEDEKSFSDLLTSQMPVKFVDNDSRKTPEGRVFDHLTDCDSRFMGIVNTDLHSEVLKQVPFLRPDNYYDFPIFPGIRYIRPKYPTQELPNSMEGGCFQASYDKIKHPGSHEFVQQVWKLFKTCSKRVHPIYPGCNQIELKDTMFYAWPDAVAKYPGHIEEIVHRRRRKRKFDYRVQSQINLAISALADLDDEVISDEDYLLIKDKNLNDENDLRYIADHVLKTSFLIDPPEARRKMIQSIDFFLNSELDLVDDVFISFNFPICFAVEDKPLFLKRIKSILETYCEEDS